MCNKKKIDRFCSIVGKGIGIHRFDMIRENDYVLIGVSGGKDSLALCLALAHRLRRVSILYKLMAVQIEWQEYPLTEKEKHDLDSFFKELKVPLLRVMASIYPQNLKGKFNCYICSRNRKELLFKQAEIHGFNKICSGASS